MEQVDWRLLVDPPAPGAWNMAVDEAILEGVIGSRSEPTLRLYAWQPACLSLGYAQPVLDVNLDSLHDNGWELVRRPTGGRAILHVDELTYSVTGSANDPRLTGGVLESYRRLSEALLRALTLIGLPAQAEKDYSRANSTHSNAPVCFEVPSNYEITVSGKKLIGSAQARRADGVLQHGSLPLTGDLTRITRALHFQDEIARQQAADRLLARALTVETALNQTVTWQQAVQAFIQAFQDVLNLALVPGTLTEGELHRAHELVEQKYAHPGWTNRV